jgi:hypothetical protein
MPGAVARCRWSIEIETLDGRRRASAFVFPKRPRFAQP